MAQLLKMLVTKPQDPRGAVHIHIQVTLFTQTDQGSVKCMKSYFVRDHFFVCMCMHMCMCAYVRSG